MPGKKSTSHKSKNSEMMMSEKDEVFLSIISPQHPSTDAF